MTSPDTELKNTLAKGMLLGLSAPVLLPLVALPLAAGMARPLARAAMKSGFVLYDLSRDMMNEFGKAMDELVAEARAGMEQGEERAADIARRGLHPGDKVPGGSPWVTPSATPTTTAAAPGPSGEPPLSH